MVDNIEIEVVNRFKYLGFYIDNKLNFSYQVNNCVRQVNYKMFLLKNIRGCMDSKTSLMIYKAMILPYLEYGGHFLVSCPKKECLKFQCLQHKCLKIALNKSSLFNTKLLHKEGRLADWENRARLASCRLMYKYKQNLDYVECSSQSTRLHDGPVYKQDQPSNIGFLKSPTFLFRKEWNQLPAQIRCIEDYDIFKIRCKRHFWELYFNF